MDYTTGVWHNEVRFVANVSRFAFLSSKPWLQVFFLLFSLEDLSIAP